MRWRAGGEIPHGLKSHISALEPYRQAASAPDSDRCLRLETELALIACVIAKRNFAEVIEFCVSDIGRQENVEHVASLTGDFRVRQIQAWRNLGQNEPMIAVYSEFLNSNASESAKLGGMIVLVGFHQSQTGVGLGSGRRHNGLCVQSSAPRIARQVADDSRANRNRQGHPLQVMETDTVWIRQPTWQHDTGPSCLEAERVADRPGEGCRTRQRQRVNSGTFEAIT